MAAAKMASSRASRPFDVIVYGASGFTGRLVAEHLARDYQGSVKWAMAGRSETKLKEVRDLLAKINPKCAETPILVADAFDRDAIGSMLKQGKVVVSTAGPYARYGNMLVEQAVEQGTHYCDITGEVLWVKRSIKQHNDKAVANGTKILHCCGFDSVPSDLGTLLMVDYMKKLGKKTDKVFNLMGKASGGFSGGTVESGRNMMETEEMSEISASGSNAYYLAETVPGVRKGTDKPSPKAPHKVMDVNGGTWTGPFVMEAVNGRVVHWSNALAGESYGSDFKYLEAVETGKGWSGFAGASAVAAGLGVFALMMAPGIRQLSKRVLPAPGEGPSEEARLKGFWNMHLTALSEEAPGVKPTVVKGHIGDPKRDPGYWGTSRMVLEAALCLALQEKQLKEAGCREGGVMSASAALGMTYVERLRQAGLTWKITEVDGKPVEETEAATKAAKVNA
uniref:Saccharopine dehydrogenase NADP binding domain-containing protein n=1 Tax=Chlamydomonas euryale TaxID=1486919 RepID=A0A7R9Z2J5_9CHLO|mmetsp:Transcript_41167/g.122924  ORF Transcript_41167/g.122924 Transcript_41167/m.122924 type:complete len:450 (+) Transcript_41167:254-1603(+)